MTIWPTLALVFALVVRAEASPTYSQTPLRPDGEETLYARSLDLIRFNVTSSEQKHSLLELAKASDADVWATTPEYIDMVFSSALLPPQFACFEHSTTRHSIPPNANPPSSVLSSNWDLNNLGTDFHSEYHRIEEIFSFTNELAKAFPLTIELVRLGLSSEGREILGIRVEKPAKKKLRPRIIIQGPQHARDWIATSSALYLTHALAAPGEQSGSLHALLDKFAFTLIPVPNPDGYVYTWDQDRLWYKNRQPVDVDGQCVGIDMNRNWGYQWENSSDPCHHWYGGSYPFESVEAKAIASYFQRTPNIRGFIDLRSYGQLLMYPFAYSCSVLPAHAEDLIEAALGASKATKKVHGTYMLTGAACHLLYHAPGSVLDWAYATAGISFSYSVSLRDTGTYGFLLPARWIRPVGEETGALIEYLANWIFKRKL